MHHIVRGQTSSIPTYSIFATFPAQFYHGWFGPFLDELIGTAFLIMFVLAVVDEFNYAGEGEPGAASDRIHRRRDRHLLRRQLRVCDQPRARLRPAHPHFIAAATAVAAVGTAVFDELLRRNATQPFPPLPERI